MNQNAHRMVQSQNTILLGKWLVSVALSTRSVHNETLNGIIVCVYYNQIKVLASMATGFDTLDLLTMDNGKNCTTICFFHKTEEITAKIQIDLLFATPPKTLFRRSRMGQPLTVGTCRYDPPSTWTEAVLKNGAHFENILLNYHKWYWFAKIFQLMMSLK